MRTSPRRRSKVTLTAVHDTQDSKFPVGATRLGSALTILMISLLSGCQTHGIAPAAPTTTEERREAKTNTPDLRDNVADFAVRDVEERAVLALINNHLKPGLARFDLALLRPILTNDFELRTVMSNKEAIVEDRSAYEDNRRRWAASATDKRKASFEIQQILRHQSNASMVVVAHTEYKSRHFSPKFVETLLFERFDKEGVSRWLLKRQAVVPLNPDTADGYGIKVLIGRASDTLIDDFTRNLETGDVDKTVDAIEHQALSFIVPGAWVSVLYIFRVPPPVGSTVEAILTAGTSNGGRIKYNPFRYTIKLPQPYFIIENRFLSEHLGGFLQIDVLLDGKVLAQKTVAK